MLINGFLNLKNVLVLHSVTSVVILWMLLENRMPLSVFGTSSVPFGKHTELRIPWIVLFFFTCFPNN